MSMQSTATTLIAVLVASGGLAANAAERRISKTELPAAVRKTADKQAGGARVLDYTTDKEDGQIEYEVEMLVNGHSKDVAIAPDGRVLEVEEQVNLNTVDPQVRSGLKNRAGNGQITKVESITKHGSIVAYEAQVRTAGRHSEIQVGPDGQPLDHEE
jgi:hypothetical protein